MTRGHKNGGEGGSAPAQVGGDLLLPSSSPRRLGVREDQRTTRRKTILIRCTTNERVQIFAGAEIEGLGAEIEGLKVEVISGRGTVEMLGENKFWLVSPDTIAKGRKSAVTIYRVSSDNPIMPSKLTLVATSPEPLVGQLQPGKRRKKTRRLVRA